MFVEYIMPTRASVFCVSPLGIHISLVICVRGYTYHGDTHITVTPVCIGNDASSSGTYITLTSMGNVTLIKGVFRCSAAILSTFLVSLRRLILFERFTEKGIIIIIIMIAMMIIVVILTLLFLIKRTCEQKYDFD